MAKLNKLEDIVSLCKRRGFIFQSSEIYGGLASCYDYGPLGSELKRNVRNAWWKSTVQMRDDVVGLDSSILMHPMVWKSSGHADKFADLITECRKCHTRTRIDHLLNQEGKKAEDIGQDPRIISDKVCPNCGAVGEFTEPMAFKLMFETQMGANADDNMAVYLRPETAQGIFANFRNVLDSTRVKVPFGIAQIGKSFRNEVTTKAFIFRTREFEQAELEFFCEPGTDEQWYEFWKEKRFNWYVEYGINKDNLRMRDHDSDELAHYAKACIDVEYRFPFGSGDWQELEGVANRTDYDLRRHQQGMRSMNNFIESGRDLAKVELKDEQPDYHKGPLSFFDEQKKQRYIPYVIEPSAGVDRSTLAFLVDAYDEEEVKGETRNLLRFHPDIAPIKAAVFPLVKKEGMPEIAHNIVDSLRAHWNVFYDQKGAIGRRYRRQDEAGTPFCITVDGQVKEDGTVTVRDRDTMAQERVHQDKLSAYLFEKMSCWGKQ
ncbi:Glycine--tRNA ligase [Sedimentisphaera cyanobacteriorum]|uniref:Glycine--tRNA ligase n=2 Tax=Sedimentisphaera cyanobacteriorum TaxID=1940790 RepID=A0A1Q2HMN1_9BACT|nr:glycine--tRNA ligase [Sedimentisphaera cyanobacteriorum]AQQ08493.1 Glycine--tRNA ligase [Sedimentisphaera cyanobacteriorum]